MAIRFRCENCNRLLSIASRKAGATVACPACARELLVPAEDDSAASTAAPLESAESSQSAGAAERRDPELRQDSGPGRPEPLETGPTADVEALERESSAAAVGVADGGGDDGGFELRKAKSEFGEMDLTPMVDVTFLLLIFFMVTASFSLQKSIEVPNPDPDQEGATQSIQTPEDLQENSVIVKIDENDVISIDSETVADPDALLDLLLSKRRDEQKNDLVIDAHEGAKHGTVVLVNDTAVEAEFQHIRLAVRAGGSN